MSPFFTPAPGMASFTVPTKMSPIEAYRRLEPPSTLMTSTSRAPLLSATLRRLSCWIIGLLRPLEDLDEPPALLLRQRPGLHHPGAGGGPPPGGIGVRLATAGPGRGL